MASQNSRCDVCFASDREVTLSPHLSSLLQTHLNVNVDIVRLTSCLPCSQLLSLWDDFSQHARVNLTKIYPQEDQGDVKPKEIAGSMSDTEKSIIKSETVEAATQTIEQKPPICTYKMTPIVPGGLQSCELVPFDSQIPQTAKSVQTCLQSTNVPKVVQDESQSKILACTNVGYKNEMSDQKEADNLDFTTNSFINAPGDVEGLVIDSVYSLAPSDTSEFAADKTSNSVDVNVNSSSNLYCSSDDFSRTNETSIKLSELINIIVSNETMPDDARNIKIEEMSVLSDSALFKEIESKRNESETSQEIKKLICMNDVDQESSLERSEPLCITNQNDSADLSKNLKSPTEVNKTYPNMSTEKIIFPPLGLPCPTCSKTFPTQICLYEHVMDACLIKCLGGGKFVCLFCSRKFNSRPGLQYHVKQHFTELSTYACNFCEKVFTCSRTLKCHEFNFHKSCSSSESLQECPFCKQKFSSSKLFLEHTTVCPHNKQPVVLIENMGQQIEHLIEFEKTIKISTTSVSTANSKTSKVPCIDCGLFVRKYSLEKHMSRMHPDNKNKNSRGNFKCSICGRHFLHRYGMLIHMSFHRGYKKKPLLSEENAKQIVVSEELHPRVQPPVKTSTANCPVCHIQFTKQQSVNAHVLRFHNIAPNANPNARFKCKICGRRFTLRPALLRHQAWHTNFKNPALQSKINKIKRQTSSTEAKPKEDVNPPVLVPTSSYGCELCGRSFTTLQGIVKHLAYHPGKKAQILKSRLMKPNRKTGKKIHSMSCSDDSKFPKDESDTVLSPPEFDCELCNKRFGLLSGLLKHLSYHPGAEAKNLKAKLVLNKEQTSDNNTKIETVVLPQEAQNNKSTLQGENCLKCTVCNITVKHVIQLKNHVLWTHKQDSNAKFKCNICELRFTSQELCDSHMLKHPCSFTQQKDVKSCPETNETSPKQVAELSCDICKTVVRRAHNLRAHYRYRHPGVKFQQQLPNVKTEETPNVGLNTLNESVACEYCDKVCDNRRSLGQHKRIHSQRQPSQSLATPPRPVVQVVKCHFCKQIFTSRTIKSHIIEFHTVEKCAKNKATPQFPCDYCHLIFISKSDRDCHFKVDHLQCSESSTATTTKVEQLRVKAAQKHKSSVNNNKVADLLQCKYCTKMFQFASTLNTHVVNFHAKEVNVRKLKIGQLKCQYCSRYLTSQKCLQRHMFVFHSKSNKSKLDISNWKNLGTFKCKICNRRLPTKNGLMRHMLHHQRWPVNK